MTQDLVLFHLRVIELEEISKTNKNQQQQHDQRTRKSSDHNQNWEPMENFSLVHFHMNEWYCSTHRDTKQLIWEHIQLICGARGMKNVWTKSHHIHQSMPAAMLYEMIVHEPIDNSCWMNLKTINFAVDHSILRSTRNMRATIANRKKLYRVDNHHAERGHMSSLTKFENRLNQMRSVRLGCCQEKRCIIRCREIWTRVDFIIEQKIWYYCTVLAVCRLLYVEMIYYEQKKQHRRQSWADVCVCVCFVEKHQWGTRP